MQQFRSDWARSGTLDGEFHAIHNGAVLRAFLCVVFNVCLLAMTPQLGSVSPNAAKTDAHAATSSRSSDECCPTDSDARWRDAPYHVNATIRESVWKSTDIHANLADVRCPDVVVAMLPVRLPAYHNAPAPASVQPLDLPLLI